MQAPADVRAFWNQIDAELAATPANPELTALPQLETEFSNTWSVKLTSIGPYRISGFISVPKGDGPFPALFLVPGYASVVTPPPFEDRQRYVVMSLRYRGTRGSDWPYAGEFPGMLTDGIEDPSTWIMRGVVADILRGFDYLSQHPEVDKTRVAIHGNDTGLFITALRNTAAFQCINASFFYRMQDAHEATEAYPLEEINDFLRTYPDRKDAVARTLNYFNPLWLAQSVSAQVLLAHDAASFWEPLQNALPISEHYTVTHEGQTDRDFLEGWLADHLGAQRLPRIWVPEDIGAWTS